MRNWAVSGQGEGEPDAGGLFDHAGTDLEKPVPKGRELGPGERHRPGHGIAQGEDQPIGRACRTSFP